VWRRDGLETLLSALVIDNGRKSYKDDRMEENSNGKHVNMADGPTVALPLCLWLQSQDSELENMDHEKKRSALLPLWERIVGPRKSGGQPLQSFKISWRFGKGEEHLVP
jgi:hypothetical protein